jgi:hypothetical protein
MLTSKLDLRERLLSFEHWEGDGSTYRGSIGVCPWKVQGGKGSLLPIVGTTLLIKKYLPSECRVPISLSQKHL